MENKSLAIFIDAENIPAKYARVIFDTASDYGDIIIKRIYGDWTGGSVRDWKEKIGEYSIVAMQQFNFASNKNSSDMYLITEVMSIFYEKDIDIFVIVSSDSDYTSLVQRLRENKKQVIGMGLQKSIKSYINAFSEFFYLDNMDKSNLSTEYSKALEDITEQLIEEKGRAEYAQICTNMNRKYSDFNAKNYGFKNFSTLIRDTFLSKTNKFKEEREKNIYFLVKNESDR